MSRLPPLRGAIDAIAPYGSRQEMNLERHRTGGMTVIAVLNIVVGGIAILAGLSQLLGALYDKWEGIFAIPAGIVAFGLLILAAGIVGIIAGIAMLGLHSWARRLSLAFGGLLIMVVGGVLILAAVFTPFIIPVIAAYGTYDLDPLRSHDLTLFAVIYAVLPVSYALVLCVVFRTPAWRATFAKG
jgi:hypothetical protein